jgi:hypothetical protein
MAAWRLLSSSSRRRARPRDREGGDAATGTTSSRGSSLGTSSTWSSSAGGAVAYLTLNLALEKGKQAQAPTSLPKGTRTLRATRGYWAMPVAELRARARDHQRRRRLRWRLERENPDAPSAFIDAWVEYEADAARSREWELWRVKERPGAAVFEPIGAAA